MFALTVTLFFETTSLLSELLEEKITVMLDKFRASDEVIVARSDDAGTVPSTQKILIS